MDESSSGCWTNHHSIIQFKNQWYLFYHDRDYSPNFDKARSVRADSLFFNDDGTIKKVIPTLRGIGLTKATEEIQIDRYSKLFDDGVRVAFLDTMDRFKGWKTVFNKAKAWIQYNNIDFGKRPFKTVSVRAASETGSVLQLHTGNINGPVIAEIKIPKTSGWEIIKMPVMKTQRGIQNLFVVSNENNQAEVDWIIFE